MTLQHLAQAEPKTGFLTCWLGGSGREAAPIHSELHEIEAKPFPNHSLHLDTDPTAARGVDAFFNIRLDGEKVAVLAGNPDRFGPYVRTLVQRYSRFLAKEDVSNGARTVRGLTQLAFAYYRQKLLEQFRECLKAMKHQGGFDQIIVMLVSSSGGGTGSALQILLPQALMLDPEFGGQLAEGLGANPILTTVSIVVEPFGLAFRNRKGQADKVLANAFAYRVESERLLQLHALKYAIHLGYANEHGAVLDDPLEIARVLGTSVYQLQRNWAGIKARIVDNVDQDFDPYAGDDIPENHAPIVNRIHASLNGHPLTIAQGEQP